MNHFCFTNSKNTVKMPVPGLKQITLIVSICVLIIDIIMIIFKKGLEPGIDMVITGIGVGFFLSMGWVLFAFLDKLGDVSLRKGIKVLFKRRSDMKRYKHRPPKEVTCPHCLNPFQLWNMQFQDGQNGTGKPYPAYQPRFARWRKIPPKFAKDPDGKQLTDKVCPMCNKRLPYSAGEQEDLIIGLVGAKYGGKSHFVAKLLDCMEGPVSIAFNAALTHFDDATTTRRKDEFQKPLNMKLELDATDPYAPPLLYNFTIADRGMNRSVTLALYDTAGENFNTEQDIIGKTRYLHCAKGLIFLLDPLQTEAVRQALPSTVRLPPLDNMTEPNEILGRVVNELRRRGLVNEEGQQLTTPVAVAFTKCDILRDNGLIDLNRLWNKENHHEGYYDPGLHNDVNGMFSDYMKQWSPAAWATINRHFGNVAFFGLSATGCSSDENGRYPRIAPWRVEDPMLWLLYQLGVIPGNEDR